MTRKVLPLGLLLVALAAGPGLLGGGRARADGAGVDPAVWQWRDLAAAAGARWDVPTNLVLAVVWTESEGDPNAYNPSGAIGLGQVMWFNADGADLWDPAQNLDTTARMLREAENAVGGWAPLPDPRGTWQASVNAYLWGHPFYGDSWYFERVMGHWYQLAAAS